MCRVKSPNSYSLVVSKGKMRFKDRPVIAIYLVKKTKRKLIPERDWIGYVILNRTKDNRYETHSKLEEKYRGSGLGTLMYRKAIEIGLSESLIVTSSKSRNENSERMWKSSSLNSRYIIGKRGGRYVVEGRRNVA